MVGKRRMFLLIGLFWLVILVGFVVMKEFTLRTGEEVLLKTMPVDPRDLFRGDYVVLSYDISTLNLSKLTSDAANLKTGKTVYVDLALSDGYGVPVGIHENPPEGKLFIKGLVKDARQQRLFVEYGIESYFVPEGKGGEIERRQGRNLSVRIAIDKLGNAAIKSLVLDGNEVEFT